MARKSDKPQPSEYPFPKWAREMRDVYSRGISYCFILHGPGVTDYAENRNVWLRESLFGVWEKTFKTIVHYSLATKVTFPLHDVTDPNTGKTSTASFARDEFVKVAFKGAKPEDSDNMLKASFKDAITSIGKFDELLRYSPGGDQKFMALVLDLAEYIAPDGELAHAPASERTLIAALENWGRDIDIQASGNIVILTTRNLADVNLRLRLADTRYYAIEMAVPTQEDRLEYIKFVEQQPQPKFEYEKGLSAAQFAKLTAGLSRVGIEDICYKAHGAQLLGSDITERKNSIIRTEYADIIEMLDPIGGFETVGGYDYLKKALMQHVITPMRNAQPADWSGILLMGPPGTGKTWIARALAKELNVPAIALNFGRQKSKYVGDTEKNVRRAFGLIRAIGQCVVFMDELDTAIPSREGADLDSGVSRGILSELLMFMSDQSLKGQVIFIAATNRPDNLDPALKRFGRFDASIPLVAPDFHGRRAVLKTHIKNFGLKVSEEEIDTVASATEVGIPTSSGGEIKVAWTGAELGQIIRKASQDKITITEAQEFIVPNLIGTAQYTALAIRECNDLSLLPPEYRAEHQRQKLLSQSEVTYEPRTAKRTLN